MTSHDLYPPNTGLSRSLGAGPVRGIGSAQAHCEGEQQNVSAALRPQINLPAMNAPEALLDDQYRYRTKPMARRPLTSFTYRLLVI
jgi:hypothetical protein